MAHMHACSCWGNEMSKWCVCLMVCVGISVYMYANGFSRKMLSLQLQVKENVLVLQVFGYRGHNGGQTTCESISEVDYFISLYFLKYVYYTLYSLLFD